MGLHCLLTSIFLKIYGFSYYTMIYPPVRPRGLASGLYPVYADYHGITLLSIYHL